MSAVPELSDELLSTDVEATRAGAGWDLLLRVTVDPAWTIFGPGAEEGLPATLTARSARLGSVSIPPGVLSGTLTLTAHVEDLQDDAVLELRYQSCRGDLCQRPRTLAVPLGRLLGA